MSKEDKPTHIPPFTTPQEVHHHFHFYFTPDFVTKFEFDKFKKEIYMALSAESQKLVDQFNTVTTKISDRIDKLIANGALSADELRAALQPIADHLDALGTDPANPVPPLP